MTANRTARTAAPTPCAIASAKTHLATPAGGWGESVQAYSRLRDECLIYGDPLGTTLAVENAIAAARRSGCYVHPSRRAE